jgi:glutathione peroxidase
VGALAEALSPLHPPVAAGRIARTRLPGVPALQPETRMTTIRRIGLGAALMLAALAVTAPARAAADCPAFLDREFGRLHSSQKINLCEAYAGKPLLIVNTASHCGFTPQFKGLEALHRAYRDRGLVIIGFPSDDFDQEAKDQAETAEVCYVNYGVTFTMLAPSAVTGAQANPVFRELARQSTAPKWNFNKYLVRPDGTVARHFGSSVQPDAPELAREIEQLL